MLFYYTIIILLFQLSTFCFFAFRFLIDKTIIRAIIETSTTPIITQTHHGKPKRKARNLAIKVNTKTNPKNTRTLIIQCTSLIKEALKRPMASNIFPTTPKAIKSDNNAIKLMMIPSAV